MTVPCRAARARLGRPAARRSLGDLQARQQLLAEAVLAHRGGGDEQVPILQPQVIGPERGRARGHVGVPAAELRLRATDDAAGRIAGSLVVGIPPLLERVVTERALSEP